MKPLSPMEIEQVAGAGAPSLADLAALFNAPSASDASLLKLVISDPAAASSVVERLAMQQRVAEANDAAKLVAASNM